jgi:hypothetical protein
LEKRKETIEKKKGRKKEKVKEKTTRPAQPIAWVCGASPPVDQVGV